MFSPETYFMEQASEHLLIQAGPPRQLMVVRSRPGAVHCCRRRLRPAWRQTFREREGERERERESGKNEEALMRFSCGVTSLAIGRQSVSLNRFRRRLQCHCTHSLPVKAEAEWLAGWDPPARGSTRILNLYTRSGEPWIISKGGSNVDMDFPVPPCTSLPSAEP